MSWSSLNKSERIQLIIESWTPTSSAVTIAAVVSEKAEEPITKNSIIGFYNRNPDLRKRYPLGGTPSVTLRSKQLRKARENAPREPRVRKHRAKKKHVRLPVAEVLAMPKIRPIKRRQEHIDFDEATLQLPLFELEANQCHWPVNDPAPGERHLFCGFSTDEGQVYCPHHTARSTN